MIIYATKQTFEKHKLKLAEKLTPPINQIAEAVIYNETPYLRILKANGKLNDKYPGGI